MSVWTTSTTGLDTVLATIGQAVNNNSVQQTPSAQHHQQQQASLIHQTSLPQLHTNTTKSHSALHLNSISTNVAGGFSGSTGSGSSPNHSTHSPHHQNHHNQNNYISQYHPTHYHSNSHLFTPPTPTHHNHIHNSFVWSKAGTVYQQKVSQLFTFHLKLLLFF